MKKALLILAVAAVASLSLTACGGGGGGGEDGPPAVQSSAPAPESAPQGNPLLAMTPSERIKFQMDEYCVSHGGVVFMEPGPLRSPDPTTSHYEVRCQDGYKMIRTFTNQGYEKQ